MEYIDKDCVIEHAGRKFEAGGAYVTPDYITAYLGKAQWSDSWGLLRIPHGDLQDWHGNKLGTYRITASWRVNSAFSDKMAPGIR